MSTELQVEMQRLTEENARLRLKAERDGFERDTVELRVEVQRLAAERDALRKDTERIEKLAGIAYATTMFRDPGGARRVINISVPDDAGLILRPAVGTARATADELRAVIDAMGESDE